MSTGGSAYLIAASSNAFSYAGSFLFGSVVKGTGRPFSSLGTMPIGWYGL